MRGKLHEWWLDPSQREGELRYTRERVCSPSFLCNGHQHSLLRMEAVFGLLEDDAGVML